MSRHLRLRPKARRDIVSAARWYESERVGLGAAFLDDIDVALHRICDTPLHYAVVAGAARRALMIRFPYAIYFRAGAHAVDVIGVLHTSRDPQRWQVREPVEHYAPARLAA
jgi:plasmid stabilization system protein ParE